jgi:putative ABC transport system permease protein
MPAVRLRFLADLRDRRRAWLVVALIAGLFAGVVVAVAAGARRTDSALARFDAAEHAPDELIFTPPGASQTFATVPAARIARLPDVEWMATLREVSIADPADVSLIVPVDTDIGTKYMRKKILSGRDVDPQRADEITVSFVLAHDHHLHVGQTLRLDAQLVGSNRTRAFRFHIVGIDAAPSEFPPQTGEGTETAWATPAFGRSIGNSIEVYRGTAVKLRDGAASVARFEAAVSKLAGSRILELYALTDQNVNTQHSIHLQAVALWLLAALLALAGALVVAQLLTRQARFEATDFPVLRGLGMSRRNLFLVGMLRVGVISVAAAVIAIGFAIAASPLLPVGLARIAEPHPGVSIDALVLLVGAIATVVLVGLLSVPSVAREAGTAERRRDRAATRSPLLGALQRAPAPSVAIGTTFAFERRRARGSVPVRSTIVGASVGLVALVAAFAFTASLDRLLATPRLYGVTFDAYATSLGSNDVSGALPAIRSTPGVARTALGYAGIPLAIDGARVDGMAFAPAQPRAMEPEAVRGRLPERAGEIMLGTRTIERLHASVGGTVQVQIERGKAARATVVGTGVFPTLSDQLGLGTGALMTVPGLQRVLGPTPPPPPDHIFVGFDRGADPAAVERALSGRVGPGTDVAVLDVQRPVDLVNFGRVQSLPLVLAAILAALSALTMAHLLVTSIHRHRTELAVLRAMGCAPSQVYRTVAVIATSLAALALLIGVPVGLLAGREIWHRFGDGLGIATRASVPVLALAIIVPATIVAANLLSWLPGRSAARGRVASILRTE